MAVGNLTEEYNDVSRNIRHYENLRFTQFVLYIAFTISLGIFIFVLQPSSGNWFRISLTITGIIVSLIFGRMEKQAAQFMHYFRSRAVEIEDLLGFKQYTKYPAGRLFKIEAMLLIILVGAMLWLLVTVFTVLAMVVG